MIKGVIFDLDGTLIDSMSVWCSIDRAFLRENGVTDPPDDLSDRLKKMTVGESAQYFIDRFGLELTKEYIISRIEELVRIEYEERIPLKPGACELLELLDEKGIPFGIATATYRQLAEAVLKRHNIADRFSFLLTDAEYPRGKRFPDIFLGGAERLGCAPAEILVAEDSLHSIRTAAAAGFVTVGVYDDFSAPDREMIEAAADRYVMSLDGIKDMII